MLKEEEQLFMMSRESQIEFMVRAARLYYEHDFSQQQIADKLGISRPGVSRLLSQARRDGIVRIEIVDPSEEGAALELRLKQQFSLKAVRIVPSDDNELLVKQRLGFTAARYLDTLISENVVLGVSWGTTMNEVAKALLPKQTRNVIVVQLNGGISRADFDTRATEIPRTIGEKLKAIPYQLPLPAVVDNVQVKNAILSDKNIRYTLELAEKANVAVFTIGSFGWESVLVKASYFERHEVENLLAGNAIADICSRIINVDGEICSPELDQRTIGIGLEQLRKKEYAIAVAGGNSKMEAVRAALRGGYCNVLITDERIARSLVEEFIQDAK